MYKRKLIKVRVRKHRVRKRCLEKFENENKRRAGKNFQIILNLYFYLKNNTSMLFVVNKIKYTVCRYY